MKGHLSRDLQMPDFAKGETDSERVLAVLVGGPPGTRTQVAQLLFQRF